LKKKKKGGIRDSSFYFQAQRILLMSSPPGRSESSLFSYITQWYALNQALTSAKDVSSVFSHTMAFLTKTSKVKNGLLGLLDGTRRQLSVTEAAGPAWQKSKGNTCEADKGICGEVLRNSAPMAISDPLAEPLLQGMADDGQRSVLGCICAPLRWGEIPLGILLIDNPHPSSEEGLSLVGTVASCISPALVVVRWGDETSLDEIFMGKLERAVERMDLQTESQGSLMADVISLVERTLILTALKKANYVQLTAARFLGINRNTLHKKIKELGISLPKP
jgi:transcriptional regulator with GAF, ATPase, and Fis domain